MVQHLLFWRLEMRVLFSVLCLTLLVAGACDGPWPLLGSSDDCKPNPGICPPTPCINGFRQGGSASCVDGEWVCSPPVACGSDAGADSGTD